MRTAPGATAPGAGLCGVLGLFRFVIAVKLLRRMIMGLSIPLLNLGIEFLNLLFKIKNVR